MVAYLDHLHFSQIIINFHSIFSVNLCIMNQKCCLSLLVCFRSLIDLLSSLKFIRMILRLKTVPTKLFPSLMIPKLYFRFGDGKNPFDRPIKSSPIERKPSSIWQRHPPANPTVHEPPKQHIEVKVVHESIKPTVVQKPEWQLKEGTPIDKTVSVPGTPTEQEPIRMEKEIQPNFPPQPLDFEPLTGKKAVSKIFPDASQETEQQRTDQNTEVKLEPKVQEVVMSNIGLNRYLTRIYITSGAALILTLTSSYTCILFPLASTYAEYLLIGGGVLSFMSFIKAQQSRPKFFQEKLGEDIIYRTQNDPVRLLMFGVGCIGMGLSAAPLFLEVHNISPGILPTTIGVTAAIFGGASLVSLLMPRSMMLGYGGVLMGGMMGVVALNLGGLIAAKVLGFTLFANTLTTAESYIGIGLFSLMIVYDTHMAIKRYERGDADHLGMSIQILLDIWNLIIRIATQIAKAKGKGGKK